MAMDTQAYLMHVSGVASLLDWATQAERIGQRVSFQSHQATLDAQLARLFCFGIPKAKRFGKTPFFAAQKREAVFFKLLQFRRVAIIAGEPAFHFIAPAVRGDAKNYPDIPPMVLTVPVESLDILEPFAKFKNLDCRGFWFDEDGSLQISVKSRLWTLPFAALPAGSPLFSDKDHASGPTFQELLSAKLESTNVYANPGFVGDLAQKG